MISIEHCRIDGSYPSISKMEAGSIFFRFHAVH